MNYYNIKNPSATVGDGKRKSYALVREWEDEDGKRRSTVVDEPRIVLINSRYFSGETSQRETEEQLRMVLLEYRSKEKRDEPTLTLHHQDNAKIYQTIWTEDYQHRYIASASNRMMEFARLLELLGHESIIATHPQKLQTIIDSHCGINNSKQRRMAAVANQLLKFIYIKGLTKPSGLVKLRKKRRKEINHTLPWSISAR